MVVAVSQAIDCLINDIREQAIVLNDMCQVAHDIQDKAMALQFAQKAVALDDMLPHLEKLRLLPATSEPLQISAAPSSDHLGMSLVYQQSIEYVALADDDDRDSAIELLGRVRTLYNLTSE